MTRLKFCFFFFVCSFNIYLFAGVESQGLTNFSIFSVSEIEKGSDFDIPLEASDPSNSTLNFPLDREKHFCACPAVEEEADYYCDNKEFYFFIKVQNWGDDTSGEVYVSDELSQYLEYISDTTEVATVLDSESDVFTDWKKIPDKENGSFPLSGDGVKIKDSMSVCDRNAWVCSETVLIRFKVKPKVGGVTTPKITNMAYITDKKSENSYGTNRSYPLHLKLANCVNSCDSPKPESCGGVNTSESSDNELDDYDNEIISDDHISDQDNESEEYQVDDVAVSEGSGCSLSSF